jgi:translation initiation factor IF-2
LNNIIFHPELSLEQKQRTNFNPNWFYLKNPKIIFISKSSFSPSSIPSAQHLESLIIEDSTNVPARLEKKHKYQYKPVDGLDTKKNKSKVKKKIRAKLHLNQDEDNMKNQYIESSQANDNLDLSLMRPVKPWKKKINNGKPITKINIVNKKNNPDNLNETPSHNISSIQDKKINLDQPLSIKELSSILLIPETEIIKWLFLQGISVTINQIIDVTVAQSIAENYAFTILNETPTSIKMKQDFTQKLTEDEAIELELRSPIVTILGHVDHGKTTLLDNICKTSNANFEIGGITQKIKTYEIEIDYLSTKKKIIFLDTPGHEAFSDMRLRCAQITDVAILVVAADDSLQPQSIEVIKYVQNHNLSLIVAINKIDKSGVNIKKVKEDLAQYNIVGKDWGGNVDIVEISALTNKNIDLLLKTVMNIAELRQLQASTKVNAEGTVLDSYLDKTKGPIATILIKNGTLKVGDFIILNNFSSKIRAIIGNNQIKLDQAGPSSIVKVWGLSQVPLSGSIFQSTPEEKQAKKILASIMAQDNLQPYNSKILNTRITVDSSKKSKNNLLNQQINLIIKTDTHGSIDAIIQAFSKIPQEKVQLNLISINVGEITESDIQLATVSQALIIGFNSLLPYNIKILAERSKIIVSTFEIIYSLVDYIEHKMLELVPLEYKENIIGVAIVENIFAISKGSVAGCVIQSGKVKHNAYIRVYRNKSVIYQGKIDSLKRVKEDVEEVKIGNECGILSREFSQWQRKDEIEAYNLVPIEKML